MFRSSYMQSYSKVDVDHTYLTKIFYLMATGLFISAITSFITLNNNALLSFAYNSRWFLFIGEIAVVFYLSKNIQNLEYQTALIYFFSYSAINGITLSPMLYAFSKSSITSAFLITAGMFNFMAFWGATTKKDLSSMGSIATMGLIGILIASVVNLFLHNSGMQLIISYIAVAVFTGLTAWDVQKLKQLSYSGGHKNLAVMGALQLYLDFINLFINVLFILNGSNND